MHHMLLGHLYALASEPRYKALVYVQNMWHENHEEKRRKCRRKRRNDISVYESLQLFHLLHTFLPHHYLPILIHISSVWLILRRFCLDPFTKWCNLWDNRTTLRFPPHGDLVVSYSYPLRWRLNILDALIRVKLQKVLWLRLSICVSGFQRFHVSMSNQRLLLRFSHCPFHRYNRDL